MVYSPENALEQVAIYKINVTAKPYRWLLGLKYSHTLRKSAEITMTRHEILFRNSLYGMMIIFWLLDPFDDE